MRKVLALCAAIAACFAVAGCGGSSTPSPVHVVNVYLDGLNHSDFRQLCATIHARNAFPTQAVCENYFAFNVAMTGPAHYRVVEHSVRVWKQTYRGRVVTLAIVQYANVTHPYVLTAHLRLIDGEWFIVAVSG